MLSMINQPGISVQEIVELGDMDPELIMTPGIFVDRVFVHTL